MIAQLAMMNAPAPINPQFGDALGAFLLVDGRKVSE
jgi:hypothetical protein